MAPTPNAVGNALYPELMPANTPAPEAVTPPWVSSTAQALAGNGQPVDDTQAPATNDPNVVGQQQPLPQGVQPTNVVVTPSFKGTAFHNLFEALGGGPKVKYVQDPDGGPPKAVVMPKTGSDIARGIIAGALTGMLAGSRSQRGPVAAFGAGGQAATQQIQQQAAQHKLDADTDWQNQQKAKLMQAQVAHAKLLALGQAYQVGLQDKAMHDQMVDAYAPQVKDLQNTGVEGADKILSESDVKAAAMKDHDHVPIPVGTVPRMDPATRQQAKNSDGVPLWDNTYIMVPKEAKVPLFESAVQDPSRPNITTVTNQPKAWVKQAQDWGLLPAKMAGTDMPVAQASALMTQVNGLNMLQNRLTSFYNTIDAGKKPGDPGYVAPTDLKAALAADPTLKKAIIKYAPFAGSSTEPDLQVEALMKADPEAGGKIMNLFGAQNLQNYKVKRDADLERTNARAKAEGTGEYQKNIAEAGKAKAEAANAGGTGGVGSIQEAAKNVVDGDLTSLKDISSMRGGQRTALFNAITREAKARGLDPKQYSPAALDSKAKMYVDYSEGKTSQQIAAFDAFLGHANDAMDATEGMRQNLLRNGSPLINKPLNWLAKNATNDSNYVAFTTALEPVRKEFMNFLNANRAEHESDLRTMQTVLSDSSTPAQIEAALKQLGKSADIRLAALGKRYRDNIGTAYPNLVSQEGQQTMQRMGINSQSAALQNQRAVSTSGQTQSGYSPNNPFAPKS